MIHDKEHHRLREATAKALQAYGQCDCVRCDFYFETRGDNDVPKCLLYVAWAAASKALGEHLGAKMERQ